jgi:hypothetical protein
MTVTNHKKEIMIDDPPDNVLYGEAKENTSTTAIVPSPQSSQPIIPADDPKQVARYVEINTARPLQYIFKNLMNKIQDEFFYEFRDKKTGISKYGISVDGATEWLLSEFLDIRVGQIKTQFVQTNDKLTTGWQVSIEAMDTIKNISVWGSAFVSIYLKKKNNELVYDDKAEQKANSKAMRNAILRLIPKTLIEKIIKYYQEVFLPQRNREALERLRNKSKSGS